MAWYCTFHTALVALLSFTIKYHSTALLVAEYPLTIGCKHQIFTQKFPWQPAVILIQPYLAWDDKNQARTWASPLYSSWIWCDFSVTAAYGNKCETSSHGNEGKSWNKLKRTETESEKQTEPALNQIKNAQFQICIATNMLLYGLGLCLEPGWLVWWVRLMYELSRSVIRASPKVLFLPSWLENLPNTGVIWKNSKTTIFTI